MKRLSSVILLAVSLFVISAEAFKPSMDGRAVVADYGELPVGFFAKSASFLPGDTVIVTNPSTKISVEVMIFGTFDSSEGIAIILSPEAARELYITKGSNSIVQVTKKNSVYTENSILSRDVKKDDIEDDPDTNPDLLINEPVFDTPAVEEEFPVFEPPVVTTVVEPEPVEEHESVEQSIEPELVDESVLSGGIGKNEDSRENISAEEEANTEPEPIVGAEKTSELSENISEENESKTEVEPVSEEKTVVELVPIGESKPEVEPEEVIETEPVHESEPVEKPEPAVEPEPIEMSEPVDEPEPVTEPEPIVTPEPEPVAENVEPEPEVEPKPVVGPEPVTPSIVNDNVGASEERTPVYPTGKTGIINREPKNTSDSIKTEEPIVEPEPVVEPELVVEVEPVEETSDYDSEMFMAEKPIELIDNEFVAVVTEPEPEPEPVPVVEPEPVIVPEPIVKPETGVEIASVTEPDSSESTAVLVPTKPNPPGPAVSEIGSTTPVIKPEKQTAMVTSDSIYEGEDRVMQKYNYTGSELSSEIYEGNSEEPVVEEISEPEVAVEPEKNVYFEDETEENSGFVDEPEVFIIPIIDVEDSELVEEPEQEAETSVEPVLVPVENQEPVNQAEPVSVEPEKTVVAQTEPEPQPVVVPVQQPEIKAVKASDLDKGCYIQIATYSKMSNVKDVIDTYGNRYPVKVVEMANGGWQILVGVLTESEYTVVLERFRLYGFKDAFLKRIK